jgi:hypothetical protein
MEELTVAHIEQFTKIWTQLRTIQLIEDIEYTIIWIFSSSGQYSTASSYKDQFFGSISTNMNEMV